MEAVSRLEAKHWALLLSGLLTASASMIGTADHWGDVLRPQAVVPFIGQIAVLISTIFVGAPVNPLSRHHEHRRKADTVSNETRAKLP